MKILVTGGNGQLGRSLNKIGAAYPQHAFVFTDMPEADITDPGRMEGLIKSEQPELIVNCAAYTAVDKAESDPASARRINAEGPRILSGIARETGIGLIHISTDYVFSGKAYRPWTENDPAEPSGVYGRTKRAGEEAVLASGCRAAVIRTAWLYSEFGNNFVKTMLRLGRERDELQVVYDQIGSPTYATDLARAILAVAEQGLNGCEIYHYSDEGAVSWYDFARTIFDLAGFQVRVKAIKSEQYAAPAPRPAYSVLAKDKIKTLGVPVPWWKDSLAECLNLLQTQLQIQTQP